MKRNHQKPSPHRLFSILFFTAILVFTGMGFTSSAQSVGVGTASPNASAILDVTSTTKGVLYPRMTTTQRNAITSPATDLTIFNTTTNCLEFYVGSAWQPIACGCTAAPSTPSSIVGTFSSLCKTPTTYTYSVPAVLGASSYTWAVTGDASATIVGQGANVVTVTYSGTTGTAITAYASNSCGNSSTTSSAISFLAAPSAPGTISYTGNTSGTNFCTSATATFSVTNVAGLTYNWTLPSGCTITAGSGTNSITATLSSSVVSSGTVSVTASNCNATGSASTLTINIGTGGSPSAPGTISYTGNITGPSTPTFCKSGTATFSVTNVTGVTYNWTLPSGCSITSGSGTNSITASLSSSVITGGTVSVTATNCLGTSSASTLTINSGTGKVVYAYTGSSQTFTVPCGVTSLTVKLWGAGGGGASTGGVGGSGAFVSGSLAVTAGNTLTLIVGGGGAYGGSGVAGTGGYGGGGSTTAYGGGGGGRSAIQLTAGTDWVTAGAGAGGGYANSSTYGGAGGATTGGSGGSNTSYSGYTGGSGGTTLAGGSGGSGSTVTTGNSGSSQTGASGPGSTYKGGGGGGGYFGGGSGYGSGSGSTYYSSGGGGGSSYTTNLTSVTNTAGNINSTGTGTAAAPNNSDVDYVSGVGIGTYTSPTTGGNGLIVISW